MKRPTDDEQAATRANFMDAMRGIATNHVTYAVNCFTPGINWARCSKSQIADLYALRDPHYAALWKTPLEAIRDAAIEYANTLPGDRWRLRRKGTT